MLMKAMRIILSFYFVAFPLGSANIAKRERFSFDLSGGAIITQLLGDYSFEFPYECLERGWYPDPHDCHSSIICDEISEVFNSQREGNETDWCSSTNLTDRNSFLRNFSLPPKKGKVFVPTEYCTCPDGSYWGGPSVGCIDDNLEDMNACCNFLADCNDYTEKVHRGDFKNCSLSALGFSYICFQDNRGKRKLYLDNRKCLEEKNVSACLSDQTMNLNDRKVKKFKIQPVCTLIRHLIKTSDSVELAFLPSYKFIAMCTIALNKTSSDGPFSIVDDFKLHNWTVFNHSIAVSRLKRIDPSFNETTDLDENFDKHFAQLEKFKFFE